MPIASPDTDDFLELLRTDGDPIEKFIIQDAEIAIHSILVPYARIWASHVYIRQLHNTNRRVSPEWMNFAGSHYTALIRIHAAFRSLMNLKELCEVEDDVTLGERLVKIHSLLSSYWWNVGAAIENLGAIIEDAPCIGEPRRAGREKVKSESVFLAESYNRRTQYIHSRVVPIEIDNGYACFSRHHLDSSDETTDWSKTYRYPRDLIQDVYEEHWNNFLPECSSLWWYFQRWLEQTDGQEDIAPAKPTTSQSTARPRANPTDNPRYEIGFGPGPSG